MLLSARSPVRQNGHVLLGLLALAALAGCENDVPDFPTYERDIKPLMGAHCIRCHGAGGMLNLDPDSMKVLGVMAPINGNFTLLHNTGMQTGLLNYTAATTGGVARMDTFLPQMPPAPAPKLTLWEHDLLVKWVNDPIVEDPSQP